MRKSFGAFFLAFLSAAIFSMDVSAVEANHPCGDEVSCKIGERSYQAVLPDDWDGTKKLSVLVHFHGWGRTGTNVIRNKKIADATRESGVLLLAPNGLGKSWSFWRSPSRDVPFVESMIADAANRWPIDRSRIYVSGFSYGGAMAWRLACEQGANYAAFLPIAGTLWNLEELEDCSAPIRLRHVHGLKDTVMDLPRGINGDPRYAVSPWVRLNQCEEVPNLETDIEQFRQYAWTSCKTGLDVELEVHDAGHLIPNKWLKRQLMRLEADGAANSG